MVLVSCARIADQLAVVHNEMENIEAKRKLFVMKWRTSDSYYLNSAD